ncbi:MAG: dihydropyrimidinase, partial [Pseudoflavonifractor sp.]
MSLLIKNATLVLPTGLQKADLLMEDGKIAATGADLSPEHAQVFDATGKLIFPGFIDTHTHFEMNKGLPT